jgi:hypothetical protein
LNFVIRAKYPGIRERGDSAGAAQKIPPSHFSRHVVDGRTGIPACPVRREKRLKGSATTSSEAVKKSLLQLKTISYGKCFSENGMDGRAT